ncbi:probable acetylcholinesterase precursor [Phialocephala subalpina]|uniref:Carboxylic ester hydrolase n=1 Tax=Phialocephala subalpina TaxID=576137 RepID=A0A1L7XT00_9HELO|nr:probable acetylcholinesterase precursor [Phialocephala subalpina]
MGNTVSYNTTDYVLDLGQKGRIKGIQSDNKSRRYAGVPYALPPVGNHRWRKPRPLPATFSYTGDEGQPFDATQFRPVCPQKGFHVAESDGTDTFSEDCLIVNIWTPVERFPQGSITSVDGESKRKKWPVYLWIHGGWFQMGDPSQDVSMNPTELISTGKLNAIVVAIGYRLNVFGFLAGKALVEESGGESAGNFGLWDQRLAIEWVRDNIEAFGGDAGNITLAGRSAGAYSVHAQVLHEFRRPAEEGTSEPFHRFFMCSNTIPAQPKTIEESEPQFNELCEYFNISETLSALEKLDELRKLSFKELLAAIEHLKNHTFRPITDDLFIHSGMVEYQNDGRFAEEFKRRKMKILIGEVLNEETLYATYNSPTEGNLESLRLQISNYYAPATTDRILNSRHYPLPETDDVEEWRALFGRIISDGQVRAPSRALVDTLVKHGVEIEDIWRYRIAYRLSFITEKVAPKSFGVSHAMDRPFWNFSIMHGPTPKERKLLEDWISILVAFVNDSSYHHGTSSIEEMKLATPECTVEVEKDSRWRELVDLGAIFASD